MKKCLNYNDLNVYEIGVHEHAGVSQKIESVQQVLTLISVACMYIITVFLFLRKAHISKIVLLILVL